MLASNALYLEHKDKLKDEALKAAVDSLQIDSNPILRIYQWPDETSSPGKTNR